jgi:hypothetical protein
MLMACRDGDLDRVAALVDTCPSLVIARYNYMLPVHLAVREGHLEIVRYLGDRGGVHPKYETYPYREDLLTIATDRGFDAIAALLREYLAKADPNRGEQEKGHIEYGFDYECQRFERLVSAGAVGPVEDLLQRRPELATNPFAFWSEGVLSGPSNSGDRAMVDLLMRYGATVPDMSKWGMEYYFKHYEIGALLLERGMDANHHNCHGTTLLHEMARIGDVRKAQLLLDHGADLNAIDKEFRSTPLGFAVRWGRRSAAQFLIARGADRTLAGAAWATPAAWAVKKGRRGLEQMLRDA